MTRAQFVQMIAMAESADNEKAVGDHGLASGEFQMHVDWRLDYWPAWAWKVLALLDRWALEHFVAFNRDGTPRPKLPARQLADLYNLGHSAPDPAYDARCMRALQGLGISVTEFDTIVE